MKAGQYTEAQITAILRQAEGGAPVAELCREHGMSDASFHKWRAKYGGMDAAMVSQMKAIEDESRRLKRINEWRRKPGTIRVDNGPEYISKTLRRWAEKQGIAIQKSNPDSRSRTPRASVTSGEFGMNGLINTSSKASRRLRIKPRNGYGITTTTAPTWASAAPPSL